MALGPIWLTIVHMQVVHVHVENSFKVSPATLYHVTACNHIVTRFLAKTPYLHQTGPTSELSWANKEANGAPIWLIKYPA